MLRLLSLVCICLMSSLGTALPQEKLQMGLSVDVIPVESDFAGQDLVVFGAIEAADQPSLYRGEYDVIIEVIGDLREAIVRKKQRISGIWVNAAAREYRDVPSYYSLHSRDPVEDVVDPSVLSIMGIGVKYLKAKPVDRGNIEEFLTQGEFSTALRRKRIENRLFSENASNVDYISPSLFRASVSLPPNVPIGIHTVKAHLFRDGNKLDEVTHTFEIRKVGFERWIYDLAHQQSFLYGVMCVLLAIFTGWFANVIFRKN